MHPKMEQMIQIVNVPAAMLLLWLLSAPRFMRIVGMLGVTLARYDDGACDLMNLLSEGFAGQGVLMAMVCVVVWIRVGGMMNLSSEIC